MHKPEIDLPEELRTILLALADGEDIFAWSANEDRSSLHLSLYVDGAPYLHSYERDSQGRYQLTGVNALGQLKF